MTACGRAIGLLAGLILLGATVAGAGTARWVEGLPPVELPPPFEGLRQAHFAELEPCPGLEAKAYVVRADRWGHPFAALLEVRGDQVTFQDLSGIFTAGVVIRKQVPVTFSDAPPQEVLLELEGDSGPLLRYSWSEPQRIGSISPGEPLPRVEGEDLEGKPWSATDLEGRVALLFWWSTEAISSVEEIPELDRLAGELGGNPRVALVAISPDSRKAVERFVGHRDFSFSHVLTSTGREVFGGKYPRHVVVDAEGRVILDAIGGREGVAAQLREAIESALAGAGAGRVESDPERPGGAASDDERRPR